MSIQYEVLSPWAEADPVPLRGISPRLTDLTNKTIGLFINSKGVAPGMLALVEEKLKASFPTLGFRTFLLRFNREVAGTEDQPRFEEWARGIDAAIT
ncbi:MAG: hypothetical protein HY675_21465, partial [Chloroflexi bacterium]|nr:hypothetical protein [Chloroflexota bacterium]